MPQLIWSQNLVLTELPILTLLLRYFKYIDLMQKNTEQKALTKYLITDTGWLILYTDHVYTYVPQCVQSAGTLESCYRDHKSIYTSIKAVWIFVHNFQCVSLIWDNFIFNLAEYETFYAK